ncbi:VRR-NUC domain-containing protein [Agromyces sp. NPDC058136]|uniref:VRR-NUC domain-containing protein n=1 Tax=Agromyces sp. NPDC058136 TaxID=3346354 RepID=UPI0036DDC661
MTTPTSISAAEYHAMQARNMTEAQLQAAIIPAAQRRDWLVYHTHDSRRSQPGFPDLVLVHAKQGRILYRELKKQNGAIRPDQKIWLRDLTAAGADAAIWRPLDWFDGTIGEQLEELLPDFKAIAAELGIELTDWQVNYARTVFRGGFVVGGRRAGRATVQRVLRHVASIEQHEPRRTTTEGAGR